MLTQTIPFFAILTAETVLSTVYVLGILFGEAQL